MISDQIKKALQNASGEAEISLDVSENPDHGDYSTNFLLKAKFLKIKAGKLVEILKKDEGLAKIVSKIEVAGPGFINFWLSDSALASNLIEIADKKDDYGKSELGNGKRILVEYSSPNIAKRFGIGHLRSTVIGQALYNLYGSIGYETIGENHLGDWGTQFGAIIAELKAKSLKPEDLTIDDLEELYVRFNSEAKDNPELWDEARNWFKKLESGDQEAREIWEKVRAISLAEFERIYSRLGIKIDHSHGESFYEDKMESVVKEVREKGLSSRSEGAEIIELEGMPPAMLTKSDGASTYFTRDLAALRYRIDNYDPYSVIYEVGSDQILHFRQVFEAARELGWTHERELKHVAHGLIRFKEGKMSTRRGKTIKFEDVLNEAIKRAQKFNSDPKISEIVGIGAIKYFDLMHAPESDIVFDWDKMLVLEGNSGPYLQYTYARSQSVLRKAESSKLKAKSLMHSTLSFKLSEAESLVLRALVHFPEIIETAAINYSPNLLCNYLFELAQRYNTFYSHVKIIGSPAEDFRLLLTSGVGQVLKNGLNLLGIQAPESM